MHLMFKDSRVPYLYILLVQWGSLVHSEHHVSTEILAIAGSAVNVTCHFEPTDSNYSIVWVVNNVPTLMYESMKPLQHHGERRRPAADQSGSKVYLEISNVTFKDAGSYKCQRYVIGGNGGTAESRVNTLHVQGDMHVEVDRNFTLNDPITAECCVRSTKSARNVHFVWFIGSVWSVNDTFGETVPTDPNITHCRHISINSELRFHEEFFGCSISSELNVTSKKPLHIFSKAIVTLDTREDTNRKATRDSVILCLANGIPPPDVHLQRLSNETEWRNHYVEEQHIEKTEEERLVLWNFHIVDKQYRDDVTYRCIANNTNDVFAHSSSTTLTVTKFDLMTEIRANLTLVIIGCAGLLIFLTISYFLAFKKRKRTRYRLSAEVNRNGTQNQQNVMRRDIPDLCSHEPISSSQKDTQTHEWKEDCQLENYQNFQVFDRSETATPDVSLAKFDDGASYGVVKKNRDSAPTPEFAVYRFDDGANYAVVKKKRIKKPMYKPPAK